jgi:hypothetical protein
MIERQGFDEGFSGLDHLNAQLKQYLTLHTYNDKSEMVI